MGWPGGMSTICCTRLVLEISSFRLTVYFWGKGDHHYTAQRSFFPLQSYSKKTLRKNAPKSAHKY